MASDWPSDVPVPSKRVLCASAPHKRFATTLFTRVLPGHTFPLQGTLQLLFLDVFLSFCSAAPACSAFVSAMEWTRPFARGLGVPVSFRLFDALVPARSLVCSVFSLLGLAFPVLASFHFFWDLSQDTWVWMSERVTHQSSVRVTRLCA